MIPNAKSTGVYLSGVLLELRAVEQDVVLRWTAPAGFDQLGEEARRREVGRWIDDELRPRLLRLDKGEPHCLGEDFGRIRDLTVMWVLAIGRDLVRRTRLVIELRQMPFRQQEQVLFALCDALPKFRAALMDAGGNGMFLAEVAATRYGSPHRGDPAQSELWYREQMPAVKAAIEDATMTLPADRDVIDDWRMLRLVRGVARVPDRRRDDAGQLRHDDAAIAGALAFAASRAPPEVYAYTPGAAGAQHVRFAAWEHLAGRGADAACRGLPNRNQRSYPVTLDLHRIDQPLCEEWLKEAGFKWHEIERQGTKHCGALGRRRRSALRREPDGHQ